MGFEYLGRHSVPTITARIFQISFIAEVSQRRDYSSVRWSAKKMDS